MLPEVKFTYLRDTKDYTRACQQIANSPRVALDTETYTLPEFNNQLYAASDLRTNPHTGRVSLLQVMLDPTVGGELFVFDLVCLEQCPEYDSNLLYRALCDVPATIAQNASFDCKMLSSQLGWLTNWHCTYVLAQVYANATGSKLWQTRGMGLAALCRDWLGVNLTGKGSVQVGEWYSHPDTRVLTNPQWLEKVTYAANDVRYLFNLRDILFQLCTLPFPQTALVKDNTSLTGPYGLGMPKVIEIEFELISIVARLETQGLPFNPVTSSKFKSALEIEVDSSALYVCQTLGLGTVSNGLWGEEIPDPQSLKLLNNPRKLLSLVVEKLGVQLTSSQAAIFRRAVDLLGALASADLLGTTSNLEPAENEQELLVELEALSTTAKQSGLELLTQILKYKKLSKQLSMTLERFTNPVTGRIHPRFSPLRASTSRFASSSPNIQQVPARLDMELEFSIKELSQMFEIVGAEP